MQVQAVEQQLAAAPACPAVRPVPRSPQPGWPCQEQELADHAGHPPARLLARPPAASPAVLQAPHWHPQRQPGSGLAAVQGQAQQQRRWSGGPQPPQLACPAAQLGSSACPVTPALLSSAPGQLTCGMRLVLWKRACPLSHPPTETQPWRAHGVPTLWRLRRGKLWPACTAVRGGGSLGCRHPCVAASPGHGSHATFTAQARCKSLGCGVP